MTKERIPVQASDGVSAPESRGEGYSRRVDRASPGPADRHLAEIHPSVGADLDHLVRVGLPDILDGLIPRDKPFWCDHVMGDTPPTLAASVRNAPDNCKAITVHPQVAHLVNSYSELFDICEERGIMIMVALPASFRRITYAGFKEWRDS